MAWGEEQKEKGHAVGSRTWVRDRPRSWKSREVPVSSYLLWGLEEQDSKSSSVRQTLSPALESPSYPTRTLSWVDSNVRLFSGAS